MKKIVVIGGGAAGLVAAISAADAGGQVVLLEKMPTIGRKLAITGKGRCNITNDCDLKTMIDHIPGNGTFLYGAFHAYFKEDIIDWLNQQGVATKVERGGRVFPVSDEAKDVVQAFYLGLVERQVKLVTKARVKKIEVKSGKVVAVHTEEDVFPADAVILAAGGASYPGTGSAGDGAALAAKLGHLITPLRPSLVPFETEEDWIRELQGLSLKNVTASLWVDGEVVGEEFGEMLFTHFGLSGPIILTLSRLLTTWLDDHQKVTASVELAINLKPALSADVLDQRIQRDFAKFSRREVKNAMGELLPAKLIPVILDLSHIDQEKFVHQITRKERQRLREELQDLRFGIRGTRPLAEAIVTAGGVNTKEINPKTMESKKVSGLYFAGEVMDVDGFTGGYNLQAAFSTGFVAGRSAAE